MDSSSISAFPIILVMSLILIIIFILKNTAKNIILFVQNVDLFSNSKSNKIFF